MRFTFLYCILIFFTSLCSHGQYSNQEIDSLLKKKVLQHRINGHVDSALQLNRTLITLAKKNNYKKGVLNGYVTFASILSVLGAHKESILYLDSAAALKTDREDILLDVEISTELGRNYAFLNLHHQAIRSYNNALLAADHIKNEVIKKGHLQYIYNLLSFSCEETGKIADYFAYIKRAYQLKQTPALASKIAKYYTIYTVKLDSASHYLAIGRKLLKSRKFPIRQESIFLRNEGRYFFAKSEFSNAVDAYQQSIAISRKIYNWEDEMITQKLLYQAYEARNDIKNKLTALKRYDFLRDSITRQKNRIMDATVADFLDQEITASKAKQKRLYTLIAVILVIAAGGIYIIYRNSKRKISIQSRKLEKNALENTLLQKKVNESFIELVELAKANDLNFYTRFREIYPEIHSHLTTICPDIRLSELVLCAYIYLDFSTKDIAEYTFKSVRTVQTRKTNLRKRLHIASTTDLYSWMKNILN